MVSNYSDKLLLSLQNNVALGRVEKNYANGSGHKKTKNCNGKANCCMKMWNIESEERDNDFVQCKLNTCRIKYQIIIAEKLIRFLLSIWCHNEMHMVEIQKFARNLWIFYISQAGAIPRMITNDCYGE